jgi:hypothetical protein
MFALKAAGQTRRQGVTSIGGDDGHGCTRNGLFPSRICSVPELLRVGTSHQITVSPGTKPGHRGGG